MLLINYSPKHAVRKGSMYITGLVLKTKTNLIRMWTTYRDIPDAGSNTVVNIHKGELWQSQVISAAVYWPCQTKNKNLIRSQESNMSHLPYTAACENVSCKNRAVSNVIT
jgi:hypothetical protein